MQKKSFFVLLAVWVAGAVLACAARAGETEEKARTVLENNRFAVVTVRIVVKQRYSMAGMGGQEEESRSETTGTVIGPDGLTVVALSATDPSSLIKNMMSGMMDSQIKIDSELSDVKILREDNSEVPAHVVLRDVDLDLAFVRPKEAPAKAWTYVDLADAGEARILDTVVTINRLGKVANRAYAASFERVNAIVEKPRKFYIPGNDPTNTSHGCPAFALDGKVIGVFVIRSIKNTEGGGGMFGGMMDAQRNMTAIILPAADIAEGAAQAPEPAAPETPEEEETAPESVEIESETVS